MIPQTPDIILVVQTRFVAVGFFVPNKNFSYEVIRTNTLTKLLC